MEFKCTVRLSGEAAYAEEFKTRNLATCEIIRTKKVKGGLMFGDKHGHVVTPEGVMQAIDQSGDDTLKATIGFERRTTEDETCLVVADFSKLLTLSYGRDADGVPEVSL